jgi:ribosome biogenesis protein Tsr3
MNDIRSSSYFEGIKKGNVSQEVSESAQTVEERIGIGHKDLDQGLLDRVAEKLRAKQEAEKRRKHGGIVIDSSWACATNIAKECKDGLALIESSNMEAILKS